MHRDTGTACAVTVYASNEEAAVRLANAQDILVDAVEIIAIEEARDEPVAKRPSAGSKNAPIVCPHCSSTNVTATKKGFGLGKAVAGGVVLGPVGLLAGVIGSNKVKLTCLKCGKVFYPGAP